jgi:tRNA nucleotidyltransferase (CCA-adding enzyme)
VVEGEVDAIAQRVADRVEGRLVIHERFRTATVHLGAMHLDFVGARRESYPEPGALPEVEPGTLDDDLRRRDFTINAMALRLVGEHAGELIDPLGGRADLTNRVLRQLREGAFIEDPSRLLRGVRYVTRLGLALEQGTLASAQRVAPELDWSNARVAEELRRVFRERDPVPPIDALRELGARGFAPADQSDLAATLDAVLERDGMPDAERWPLLMGRLATQELLRRVALPEWAIQAARASASADHLAAELLRDESPSAADRRLATAQTSAAIMAAVRGARWAAEWLVGDRRRVLDITGEALIAAGVAEGPAIGRGLAAARASMLDGHAPDRESQLRVALAAAG